MGHRDRYPAKNTVNMNIFRNPYTIKNGVVHWGRHPVANADPTTFEHLGGDWGRDEKRVFVQDTRKKVDIATFKYLNPVFAKDGDSVYDWDGKIKGADAKTFDVLDPGIFVDSEDITTKTWARGYARDCRAVYYHDQMTGRASALRRADPDTFVSLRNDF